MRRVLAFGVLALSFACRRRAAPTPFDEWLENPFPPAGGFSFPVGDGGGEGADIAQSGTPHPVMAIATGKVVVARKFDDPRGLVVMIEHIVLDGYEKKRIRSQYAHLSRINVHEGDIVRGRQVIGTIGQDSQGAHPADLHFEIRSDLALPYADPSAFIRSHRVGFDAAWGLEKGIIDQETAGAIAAAWSDRKLTPQNTPLGSGIGFHGWASEWDGGAGAHLSFGCVVMHKADIEAFFEDVPIGTMVVIF